MHPKRKQRLILVLLIVVGSSLAVGLLAYALRSNINLFYPPSAIAAGNVPVGVNLRAGGCVKPGSVIRSTTDLGVSFIITDGSAEVPVVFTGILPDLFAEGEAAVINGVLNAQQVLEAREVLAKHDENYVPPEVAEAMEGKGEHQATCGKINYAG